MRISDGSSDVCSSDLILGMQVALQALGRGQALEDAALLVAGLPEVAAGSFHAFVEPATLLRVRDVHELGADRAGMGGLEQREQVTQLHPRVATAAAGSAFRDRQSVV